MPDPQDTFSAPKTFTRAAGAIEDTDGIKTSAATPTANTTYVPANFDGADAAAYLNSNLGPARTVSVTTGASVGTYRTGASFPIVVTGTYGGVTVTENLLLSAANGGETIRGVQPFDTVTSIAVPGQVDINGTFQFGVQDICGWKAKPFRGVKAHADATLTGLAYQDGTTDALVVLAHAVESALVYKYPRTLTGHGVTLYF